jgi:carbon monoxide dehydrogenase subunit G
VEIKDSFMVSAPPDQVWELLLDVERVAPCMPGAELTETIDENAWSGRVKMKVGPVTMKYAGKVVRTERHDVNRRMTLLAEGTEESGKGGASATVRAAVEPTPDGGSCVEITQELALTGAAAQFGGRMIADVSAHLTKQFAGCLRAQLPGGSAADQPKPGEAVPALGLAFWAMWRALGRMLRLPWGRSRDGE